LIADGPEKFSAAITELFHDQELYRRLAEKAKELAIADYAWQTSLRIICRV